MKAWQRSNPMGTMGVVGSPQQGNFGTPGVPNMGGAPTLPAQASPIAVAAVQGQRPVKL